MPISRRFDATCQFDLSTALQLARAAELAYSPPEEIEREVLDTWRCSHFTFIDVETTQCLIAADEHTTILCFRGTEGNRVQDWIADLDFDLVPGPLEGRVHEGFYDALSCVWHLLDREVRRLQSNGQRRLWVTGHSLGAGWPLWRSLDGTMAAYPWPDFMPLASRESETMSSPAASISLCGPTHFESSTTAIS